MSDMTNDARARLGSPSDRKMSTAAATATGAAGGLAIGFVDWIVRCFQAGHIIAPDQSFIEIAAPIIVLPMGLWVGRVFSLIGTIITNRLEKDAST